VIADVKEQVIELVRYLPDEVTVDDIMRELYFKIQVDKGLKELDEGKGIPHEDVERRLSRWLSK
jgi:predicted transcriptional regulator